MRQVPNGKRSRNRPGRNNRPSNSRNQTFDSSGPEGKVRGSANQVYEKYLALARDAQSSGDRIGAENFFQHAEHYFRIMTANGQQMRPRPMNGFGDEFDDENEEMNGQANGPHHHPQHQPQPQAQPQREAQAPQPVPGQGPQPDHPKTPAELAQAAAANSEGRGGRERGRRPRRNAGDDTNAEATS